MTDLACFADPSPKAVPITLLRKDELPGWLAAAAPAERAWVEANAFTAAAGKHLLVPGEGGRVGASSSLMLFDRFFRPSAIIISAQPASAAR